MTVRWLAHAVGSGLLAARLGREGDRLVADWPGRARFSVNCDGGEAVYEQDPNVPSAEGEKLRRGVVALLLAHLGGAIPLHASAVAVDGRAVVFVGSAGFGKSTLAAAMCELAGASLLGDDGVAIERCASGFEVVALHEDHWLDAAAAREIGRSHDAADTKRPISPRRIDVARAPLALIAHLAFTASASGPKLEPVSGVEAVAGLLSQLTRLVVDDPVIARRDLAALADLVEQTPVVRLERARAFGLLRPTCALVARAIRNGTSP
jgi:hypothetical protein